MTIGEKIYSCRKKAGMSQEELANRMNVTRQSISLWETDQTVPSVDSLIALAEIFSISLDELCGKDSEKPAASEASPQSEEKACSTEAEQHPKEDCLAYAETKYTPSLLNRINKVQAKILWIICAVIIALEILTIIFMLVEPEIDNELIITLVIVITIFAVLLIRSLLSIKPKVANFFRLYPNCMVKIRFYNDRLEAETVSDNSQMKCSVPFSEIKSVKIHGNLILVYFCGVLLPIELSDDANSYMIRKLLTVRKNNVAAAQSKPIKKLLLAIFILTIAAPFIALICVAVAANLSPLPGLSYIFPEFMWIFLLYLPLPLASLVLGIAYCIKRYKAIKNIIAGAVVSIVVLVFGTMGFTNEVKISHDFGYVTELEQTILVNLPNSGYITRAENTNEKINSIAMIKFDDKGEIVRIVSEDTRFEQDINAIGTEYIHKYNTRNYDYFMLYDVTCGEVNNINIFNGSHMNHRFVYLAYSIEKNIMYVVDYVS